jgi:hypothetical protein
MVKQMIRKNKIAVLFLLASIMITATPAMLNAQGQTQTATPEKIIGLADGAEQQVKNLIDLVYANETTLQTIEEFGLLDELEGNVSHFNQGVEYLANAHAALESLNYESAVGNATSALQTFREVFKSIHIILEDAGLEKGQLIDNEGLLEAISRTLQRINRLRAILPADATNAIALLDQAESYLDLDAAKQLLLEGNANQVVSDLTQAKELISQVYDFLKEKAEESNTWRINDYCLGIQERTRERFRYGREQGIDTDAFLQSLGYQNETQFMETLQNMTQTAQGNIQNAMQELEAINQMFQQMNQAFGQEVIRRQGGNGGSGGSDGGGPGAGSSGGGSGQGYGGG